MPGTPTSTESWASACGVSSPAAGGGTSRGSKGIPPAFQDTDENAADFGAPSGEADGTPCGEACAAPPAPTAIDAIQGSSATSPMVGAKVQITGIVVGVDNQVGVSNYTELDPRQAGIYVETPTAEQDNNTQTSEGIFFVTPAPNRPPLTHQDGPSNGEAHSQTVLIASGRSAPRLFQGLRQSCRVARLL